MRASPIPTKSRELVKHRERLMCLRCGSPGSDWHHRKSRSIRNEMTHSPCNGVWLCRTCHSWAHGNPTLARETGFIVPSWEDPLEVPVASFFGSIMLDAEGSFTFTPPKGATDGRS